MATPAQTLLFQRWSVGTTFVLDINESPKREFGRLALHLRWEGGDADWKRHWQECFGEEYPYTARWTAIPIYGAQRLNDFAVEAMLAMDDGHNSPTASSAGISVADTPCDSNSDKNSDSGSDDVPAITGFRSGGFAPIIPRNPKAYEAAFERLYGTDVNDLSIWQVLCRDVGLDPALPSITKCRKALQGVLVNIYDLIDHRNGPGYPNEGPLIPSDNWMEFRAYTLKGRVFPKKVAKKEGFIKKLLRKVRSRKSDIIVVRDEGDSDETDSDDESDDYVVV